MSQPNPQIILIKPGASIDFSTPILLIKLVALEAVLSADNAIALASISQSFVDE